MSNDEKKWIKQWKAAAVGLEEQRALELAAMTDEQARRFTETLLSLADHNDNPRGYSGLVEQQRYFHRRLK